MRSRATAAASHPTAMKQVQLGHSDLMVTIACLGTMTFGKQNTESEAHAQLDAFVRAGGNFIDTAELYPVPPEPDTCGSTEVCPLVPCAVAEGPAEGA